MVTLELEQKNMDKEKLLSDLKGQLGTTSLSERTINEYVDAIIPGVTDESVTEDFWKLHTKILKTVEGQLNNEVATKVNGFKTEWEKNHPKQEPQQQQQMETPKFSETEEYKALMNEINTLKSLREEESKSLKVANLRNSVIGKAKDLNVSNNALWNDVVNDLKVEADATEESVLNLAKSSYEAKLKAYMPSAVPFGASSTGSPSAAPKAEAEARRAAFKARMQAEGRLPKDE